MHDTIFRLNDIRGEIDIDMTVEDMARIAHALVVYIHRYDTTIPVIAIGRDGRLHSPAIYNIMKEAFERSGLTVINLGICPTPVVQFMMHKLPVDLALMITASHNGPTYNGCKIFYHKQPLCGDALQELRYIATQETTSPLPLCINTQTTVIEVPSATRYVDWLYNHFLQLKGWNAPIIFDCGSGATGAIMPLLIDRMEWPNAKLLYAEIDGRFPFHEADPIVHKNMHDLIDYVVTSRALCGIGFDGDGDRMGAITETGHHVRGDNLLAIFSQDILKRSPQQTIVFDNKCAEIVQDVITQEKGIPYRSPSGHALIRKNMVDRGAIFGGELSCHFFFADYYFGYDDGIYAALRLLDILHKKSCTLDTLLDQLPKTYSTEEWRIAYSDQNKWDCVAAVHATASRNKQVLEISTLDGIRIITSHGWVLLRASQTQPALCLRGEAYNKTDIIPLGALIKNILQPSDVWPTIEASFDEWLETAHGKQTIIRKEI
jgi:phosphomannomutase/phosphoglucomutase